MLSQIHQDAIDTLADLRVRLKETEDGYNTFQKERIPPESVATLDSALLTEASDLITKAGNDFAKSYGVIEELVNIYEGVIELFDIELIDGRIVSDIFVELEDTFHSADNLIYEYQKYDDSMVEISNTVTDIYDKLSADFDSQMGRTGSGAWTSVSY